MYTRYDGRSNCSCQRDKRRRFGICTEGTESAEDTEKAKEVQELKVEKLKEEDREERRVVARISRAETHMALTQRREELALPAKERPAGKITYRARTAAPTFDCQPDTLRRKVKARVSRPSRDTRHPLYVKKGCPSAGNHPVTCSGCEIRFPLSRVRR